MIMPPAPELVERFCKLLGVIADGNYTYRVSNFELYNLVEKIDSSVAKAVVADLSQAFAALYELYPPNASRTVDAEEFCILLANELRAYAFDESDFKHFVEVGSCPLLSYVIENESMPIGFIIEGDFENKFKDSRNFHEFSGALNSVFSYRRNEVVNYFRNKLSGSIDCSILTDEMVLSVAGISI